MRLHTFELVFEHESNPERRGWPAERIIKIRRNGTNFSFGVAKVDTPNIIKIYTYIKTEIGGI
jgi:hypothetical protein